MILSRSQRRYTPEQVSTLTILTNAVHGAATQVNERGRQGAEWAPPSQRSPERDELTRLEGDKRNCVVLQTRTHLNRQLCKVGRRVKAYEADAHITAALGSDPNTVKRPRRQHKPLPKLV